MRGDLVDAHRLARRGEAARDQQIQNGAIVFRHDPRRAHRAAPVAVHDLVRLLEMRPRALRQRQADLRQRALDDHAVRIVGGDAGMQQRFARQIEPAEAGVLVDVAQDVGELQRAAEMMREQDAVCFRQAEHPHRQPPDGAGDAIAIEIERRHVGRADVLRHVHLHAVDDGEEILALEAEGLHRGDVVAAAAPADGPGRARRCRRATAEARPAARRADHRNRRCRRPDGRSCRSGTSPRAGRAAGCASRRRTNCRMRSMP